MVHEVPQPSVARMVVPGGHPLVVEVAPAQPDLVLLTAARWLEALGASALYCAYADESRLTVEEHPDGTVRHVPVDPDGGDDEWRDRERELEGHLRRVLAGCPVPWHLRYLAGRPDRALTHLARAVDAAAFVVGTRAPGAAGRVKEWLGGSVAVRLAHHQHRPVLVVPVEVVDWKNESWR